MMRFRTALLATLLGVVVATVAAVGVSSFFNARFAVEDLTAQILEQTVLRIDQHVQDTLEMAVAESRLAERVLQTGIVDITDPRAVQRYFLEALNTEPTLSFLSYGTEEGEYWHANRERDGRVNVQDLLFQPDGSQLMQVYVPAEDGSWEITERVSEGLERRDPRNRPYYREAIAKGAPLWTESYVFLTRPGLTEVPGVTRATPITLDGRVHGVLTADFDFWALSQLLAELPVGEQGFAYILEQRTEGTRRVIAHPDPTLLTRAQEQSREIVPADAFQNAAVRAFSAEIPARSLGDDVQIVTLDVDGKAWVGGFCAVRGEDRPDWLIVAALPVREVMSRVRQMNRITLATGTAALALALALALVLSSRLSAGLDLLRGEIEQISRLQIPEKDLGADRFRIVDLAEIGRNIDTMKHGLRSFSRYVPQQLVRKLLASGSAAELGAEQRHVTVVFTDIVGFTTHVETHPSEVMFTALSGYLDVMNIEIDANDGVVCQYLGDAIMALFGAPFEVPDHPLRACRAALAMKRRGDAIADQLPDSAPQLRTRFGVNTGMAMVGNIGAADRFNYVALGDTVNTAARLESLNKTYGTWQLISEETANAVNKHLMVRPVDWVRMKGKQQPVFVYELVGEKGDPRLEEAIAEYQLGLERYRKRDFRQAIEAFEIAAGAFGGTDPASEVLIGRCREYLRDPPPADWDGVYTMDTK